MATVQSYIITIASFAAAFLLIFRMGKENKLFYAVGGGVGLYGCIRAVQLFNENLFSGVVFDWIFRGILFVCLILLCTVYFLETKKRPAQKPSPLEEDEDV